MESEELAKEIQIDYKFAFMHDALMVMREILEAGKEIFIFTSKPAPKLREQLSSTLGKDIGEVRWGNKGDPTTFKIIYELEMYLGNRLFSHTADKLPELIAARKSGLFHQMGLIYVNRNDSNLEDVVKKAGVEMYVNDLRDVGYIPPCFPLGPFAEGLKRIQITKHSGIPIISRTFFL